jgi:hypothetical protein
MPATVAMPPTTRPAMPDMPPSIQRRTPPTVLPIAVTPRLATSLVGTISVHIFFSYKKL